MGVPNLKCTSAQKEDKKLPVVLLREWLSLLCIRDLCFQGLQSAVSRSVFLRHPHVGCRMQASFGHHAQIVSVHFLHLHTHITGFLTTGKL